MGHFDNKPIPMELKTVTFDVTEAWVNTFQQNALSLIINDPNDKDVYEKVKELLKTAVSKRQEVEAKRKELNEDALKWQRAVNSEAKRITALLEPSETHLRTQKEFYDLEKEKIKRQKEIEAEQLFQFRVSKLSECGFTLVGDTIVNHAINQAIPREAILYQTEEIFDTTIAHFKKQYETYLFEKEEKERQERVKQEEFDRQQREIEQMKAEMLRIKQEMEETQRQKKEAEELAELIKIKREREIKVAGYKAKFDKIKPQLIDIGFKEMESFIDNTEAAFTVTFFYESKHTGNFSINSQHFIYLSDAEFIDWFKRLSGYVDAIKIKDIEAEEEQKKLIEEQIKEKMRLEAEAKAEAEKQEKLRKEELKANMNDTEKIKEYINELLLVKVPEMKTKTGIAKLKSIEKELRFYL